jgi:hypothetical protein
MVNLDEVGMYLNMKIIKKSYPQLMEILKVSC